MVKRIFDANVKGYNVKKFLLNWVIITLAILVVVVVLFSRNSLTNDIDLNMGFEALGELFGGVLALMSLLGFLAFMVAFVLLLVYMTNRTYTKEDRGAQVFHIVLIVASFIAAMVIGGGWIKFGDESFWIAAGIFLVSIAFITLVTALVTHRIKVTPVTTP